MRHAEEFLLGAVGGFSAVIVYVLLTKQDELKRRILRRAQEDSLRNQERALFGDDE